MAEAAPSFGLTADELQQFVTTLLGANAGASDEVEWLTPAMLQIRRVALEAAAALIAANNRRLTEQLGAVSTGWPVVPTAAEAATNRAHNRPTS